MLVLFRKRDLVSFKDTGQVFREAKDNVSLQNCPPFLINISGWILSGSNMEIWTEQVMDVQITCYGWPKSCSNFEKMIGIRVVIWKGLLWKKRIHSSIRGSLQLKRTFPKCLKVLHEFLSFFRNYYMIQIMPEWLKTVNTNTSSN